MLLNTAAQVLSMARQLEEDGAAFYEALAQRAPNDKELLLAYARENKKNILQVERAYYDAISDALEGTFAFALDSVKFGPPAPLPGEADFAQGLKAAESMERKTAAFYVEAARQCKSFLGDIPRAFLAAAKKRAGRLEQLKALA